MLDCLKPYSRPLGILAALSLAEVALRVLIPWPMKALVDRLVGNRVSVNFILETVAASLALQLSHQLVLLAHTRRQTRVSQRLVYETQSRIFAQLQYLSLQHHERLPTSDSVYRVNSDAACLENLMLRGVFPMAFSVITLMGMFLVLVRLEATLAVVSMIVVPFLYVGLRFHMRRMQDRAERAKKTESAVMGRVIESLSAIRLVKAFAREEHELSRFDRAAQLAMRERWKVMKLDALFSFMVGAVTVAGASAVLALGGVYVAQGRITVGTLLVIMTYLGFVYGPLSAIATTTGSLQQAFASLRRVREVLELPRETSDAAGAVDPGRLRGAISFVNVSFAYPTGAEVLHDVTFHATPGEMIALVGPSGAGKTTLLSLLGRMYEAKSGCISIDDLDIRQMRLRSLREQIAVVPQEPILFSGTVAENIRYGYLAASHDAVVRAARAAYADDFISRMDDGFDTPLRELGGGLSVGQRQRISMARAFLKDAPILILDEPTASLDTISEARVLEAMRDLRQQRTTFVIAHRLSSVRDADRILVLDAGRLIASGTHEDLLRSCGLYRRLCAELVDDAAVAPAIA
jgi:ATP-binding cassette subfamily B protein